MDLVIKGRDGTRACGWEGYALLRDNVLHFVDGDQPSGRFPALYGIARAIDGDVFTTDAVHLRLEVLRAWRALQRVPLARAAASSRTRAIRTGRRASLRALRIVAIGKPRLLPGGAPGTPLPWLAADFLGAVLELTESAVAGDTLEVRRKPGSSELPALPAPAAGAE
jgi:hypothetical protein